ncbi:helix-turn-helix domain-containing protein [Chloroflexota bacterium]
MKNKETKEPTKVTFLFGSNAKVGTKRYAEQDAMLREILGEYFSAKDLGNRAGIKSATLLQWREKGKLRSVKIGSAWYYSRQDIQELIKTY